MLHEIFPATMAQRRFEFLLKCLRFDDTTTRDQRKQVDNLAAGRTIFERFNENCKKNYLVGANVTLDEILLTFRETCHFRMYMPQKPNKYRTKIFSLVDQKHIIRIIWKCMLVFTRMAHIKVAVSKTQNQH